MEFIGARLLYLPPSALITDRPWVMIVQRVVTNGNVVECHGRGMRQEPLFDVAVGDPDETGSNTSGYLPATFGTGPALGGCWPRPVDAVDASASFTPSYATLKRRDGSFTIALLANTWAVLTGGNLGETTLDPSAYTSNTGELVVPTSGVYAVSLSVTASRSGLTAPTVDIAVYADGALTDVEEQTGLALAGQPGSIHARAHVELAAGAVLTPRIRSSLGLTLGVPRWTLAFERVG